MALSSWLNSVLMGRQAAAQLSSAQHNSEAILLWELTAQTLFSMIMYEPVHYCIVLVSRTNARAYVMC